MNSTSFLLLIWIVLWVVQLTVIAHSCLLHVCHSFVTLMTMTCHYMYFTYLSHLWLTTMCEEAKHGQRLGAPESILTWTTTTKPRNLRSRSWSVSRWMQPSQSHVEGHNTQTWFNRTQSFQTHPQEFPRSPLTQSPPEFLAKVYKKSAGARSSPTFPQTPRKFGGNMGMGDWLFTTIEGLWRGTGKNQPRQSFNHAYLFPKEYDYAL